MGSVESCKLLVWVGLFFHLPFLVASAHAQNPKPLEKTDSILKFLTSEYPVGPALSEKDASLLLEQSPSAWIAAKLESEKDRLSKSLAEIDSDIAATNKQFAEIGREAERLSKAKQFAAAEQTLARLDPLEKRVKDLYEKQRTLTSRISPIAREIDARADGLKVQSTQSRFESLTKAWSLYVQWLRKPSQQIIAEYRSDVMSDGRSVKVDRGVANKPDEYHIADIHFRQSDKAAQTKQFLRVVLAERDYVNAAVELINSAWNGERQFLNLRHDQLHRLLEVRSDAGALFDNRFHKHFEFWTDEIDDLRSWLPRFRHLHDQWHQIYRRHSPHAWQTPYDRPIRDRAAAVMHDGDIIETLVDVQLPNGTREAYHSWLDSNIKRGRAVPVEESRQFVKRAFPQDLVEQELKLINKMLLNHHVNHLIDDAISLFDRCRDQIDTNNASIRQVEDALNASKIPEQSVWIEIRQCLSDSNRLCLALDDAQATIYKVTQNSTVQFDKLTTQELRQTLKAQTSLMGNILDFSQSQ